MEVTPVLTLESGDRTGMAITSPADTAIIITPACTISMGTVLVFITLTLASTAEVFMAAVFTVEAVIAERKKLVPGRPSGPRQITNQ